MGLKEFAEYLGGKGLSKGTMRSYLNYYKLFEDGLDKEELNQYYVNRFLLNHSSNATRSFLNNLFDFLDIDNFKVPKLTGAKSIKKRRKIRKEEIKILRKWLYHNKNPRYLLCFDLSYYCALRRAEVMGIKIEDFNLKEWSENPEKSCRLLIRGKRNRERFVPVPSKLMHRIIDYIQEKDKGLEDRLFAFHYVEWNNAFKDAVKETIDYNFTLHDLRRTRATKWLEDGIDIIRVKNRLGHSSISTTQRYINLEEEKEYLAWSEE